MLWHGNLNLEIDLLYFFNIIKNYLRDHSTETVIVVFNCWWDESDWSYCGEQFVKKFNDIIDQVGRPNFYPTLGRDETIAYSPTLGEVRGKIVLYNRQSRREKQDKIPSLQSNDENRHELNKDKFDYSIMRYNNELISRIIEVKKEIYKQGGAASADKERFYFTWLSANNCANDRGTPESIATQVNPWIT